MRLSTCFSHVEENEKSWFSTRSISIQVTYYWCHTEPWQLTVLMSQRSRGELVRHAAESMTRPVHWGGGGGAGKTEDNAPHNCKSQNAEPFWRLLRVTEEIRKLKQKSGVQGSLIHAFWRSFFPYLASTYWCYRKAQKKATEPRFMPRPVLSSLSDLSLISTLKNLYFQNKHDTISVNRENLT